MFCQKSYTKDGLETQIGVNHFGHFLLTQQLLDLIKVLYDEFRLLQITLFRYKVQG